jgi:tetratricopeptide (TPR) repeat protein
MSQGDDRLLSQGLVRLGNALLWTNADLDLASQCYAEAATRAHRQRDDLLAGLCLANQAAIAFRRWHLEEAIRTGEQALATYTRTGHQIRIGEARLNLGFFRQLVGDIEAARALLGEVLSSGASDWILTSMAQENLADCDRREGNEASALRRLADAERLCEAAGAPRKQAQYLGMIAESLWATGDFARCITAMEQALRLAGRPTLSHGLLEIHFGDVSSGVEMLAAAVRSEVDPQRRAAALLQIARGQRWLGRLDDAVATTETIAALLAPSPVPRYLAPVQVLQSTLRGDIDGALLALTRCVRYAAPAEAAEAALDAADALLDGTASPEQLRRYLELTASMTHGGIGHRLHWIRAAAHERLGEAAEAKMLREHALEELNQLIDSTSRVWGSRLANHVWTRRVS